MQIAINLEPNQADRTDNFIRMAGYEYVANDTSRTLARRFQTAGQPIFAIINGVENSPNYKQWELLLHQNGYGTTRHPITTFRGAIDAVKAPVASVAPAIERHPQSQTVLAGVAVTFQVTAAGTEPLSFQWQFNGTDLPGATSASLTLNNVQGTHAGTYRVMVRNAAGSVTSQAAELIVQTPVLPPQISKPPQGQTVVAGTSVLLVVSAAGTGPLRYQWSFNGQELPGATAMNLAIENVQWSHAGEYAVVVSNEAGSISSPPARLMVDSPPVINLHPQSQTVIAGAPVVLSILAEGSAPIAYQWQLNGQNIPDATRNTLMIDKALASHAGQYRVVVSNNFGSATSAGAALTVLEPPVISVQPQSQTVRSGAAATFTATAAGTEPLSYQWKLNDAEIPGATGPTFTVSNATLAQAGRYSVVVRNAAGTIASQPATLVVELAPATPPRFSQVRLLSDGGVELTLAADAGLKLQLEVSSDLLTWHPLTTLTAADGITTYRDAQASSVQSRFYRAHLLVP